MGSHNGHNEQAKVRNRTSDTEIIQAHICVDKRMYAWSSIDCDRCVPHQDIFTTYYSIRVHNQLTEETGEYGYL